MPKSAVPTGSQFSPSQIKLPRLLELAVQHAGDRQALMKAIYEEFFPARKGKTGWYWKLADNTQLGMRAYGILEEDASTLTPLGRMLYELRRDEAKLYAALARHILLNLRGVDVIETVTDMLRGGHKVTIPDIARNLAERGLYVPEGGTHLNSLKQWLDKAGLFVEGWRIDERRYQETLGVSTQELEALAGLNDLQRAFARAFARLGLDEMPSNKVADYASELYGVRFSAKGLPSQVLNALEAAGLVTTVKSTSGRGAKPHLVRSTPKLGSQVLESIFSALEQAGSDPSYRRLVRMSFEEIQTGLRSRSTHEKGMALEALAFYLSRLIDLQFVAWRRRSVETAGAEVDVIVEGTRLIFSRWQIQCKNTRTVSIDDVAKEVGVATVRLKSNVIMVVTTGQFSTTARDYARDVMEATSLNVVLLDGADLAEIGKMPAEVTRLLKREAQNAMRIKKLQLDRL